MSPARLSLALLFGVSCAASAADLPAIPSQPVARKTVLRFADDFTAAEANPLWHRVVPTFVREQGALKGSQTRDRDQASADGQKVIKAHAAVHGLELPTRDSVVEARIRFDGATMIDVEFDDRKYTGAHYGHLCRAQVRLNGVTVIDERDGGMRNDIRAMRQDPAKKAEVVKLLKGRQVTYPAKLEAGRWYTLVVETAGDEMRVTIDGRPAKKAEVAKLLKGRQVTYPAKLEAGRWYTLVVETAGDEMRVTIDGRPAAYLKSSGIAHATKSKIEFGVAGKDGWFDDLKVWDAEPVRR